MAITTYRYSEYWIEIITNNAPIQNTALRAKYEKNHSSISSTFAQKQYRSLQPHVVVFMPDGNIRSVSFRMYFWAANNQKGHKTFYQPKSSNADYK